MISNFRQPISNNLFGRKYCLHGETSAVEVFQGVSTEIASPEKDEAKRKKWQGVFYESMFSGEFIPAGRILANARPASPMKNYNNCFTIDLEDSMEGIFTALKEDALISKMGGGVGFNISKLRPKGTSISKGGESSGVLSFLEIFDRSAKAIHTGGGRRGAHIAILNIDHPDIEEFITYKQGDENKKLTQFNISVGITDKFIKAVEKDEDWELVFDGKVYKTLKARELYDLMIKHAWWYNEPGAIFLDTVEKENNGHHAFKVDRCNPCGEIVMPPYSLCCLSSINLSKLVKDSFTKDSNFDWDRFRELIHMGVRFLDNVLDVTDYPLDKIKEMSLNWRRIGLGITGLADAMLKLGLKYGKEGVDFTYELGRMLAVESYKASVELAKEKGSFPAFDENIGNYGFITKLPEDLQADIKKYGLRNIGLNTTAPTGTTSLTMGDNCSSGIEPIFALQYDRMVREDDGTNYTETVYDDGWLDFVKHFDYKEGDGLPEYVVTSHDVKIKEGIDVQSAFQYWIDHSISKTINMPYETTLEDYKDIFMYAWSSGLKGVTSFHEGASMAGVLSTGKEKKKDGERLAPKRPQELPCDIYEMQVQKKRVIALVGLLDGKPYEIFITDDPDGVINVKHAKEGILRRVKSGVYDLVIEGKRSEYILHDISKVFGEVNLEWQALGIMTSLELRHSIPMQFVVDALNKLPAFGTFMRAMARVLKKYIEDGEKSLSSAKCPECGSELVFVEGCKSCQQCGWSKCD